MGLTLGLTYVILSYVVVGLQVRADSPHLDEAEEDVAIALWLFSPITFPFFLLYLMDQYIIRKFLLKK